MPYNLTGINDNGLIVGNHEDCSALLGTSGGPLEVAELPIMLSAEGTAFLNGIGGEVSFGEIDNENQIQAFSVTGDSLQFVPAAVPVPEPFTLLCVVGMGIAAVAVRRRRKKPVTV